MHVVVFTTKVDMSFGIATSFFFLSQMVWHVLAAQYVDPYTSQIQKNCGDLRNVIGARTIDFMELTKDGNSFSLPEAFSANPLSTAEMMGATAAPAM
mmetsp:Transcript_28871/g.50797  ORF Transcript_28871/g.50797 Transcript_28871/m.50797 type:complete len:97 (+) Transcript_28871:721-1011(+)